MPRTEYRTEETAPAGGRLHDFRFRAMNTTVYLRLRASDGQAAKAKAAAADWFRFVEQRFSRFRPDSELCRLNRAEGRPMMVSDTMLEVLELAAHYGRVTGGTFSPFVLDALARSGYDVSYEQLRERSGEAGAHEDSRNAAAAPRTADAAPSCSPISALRLDLGMKAATLPPGGALDLGGIVKSWAVERFADYLRRRLDIAAGLIKAGGDLTTWGSPGEQEHWSIGIEHPWEPDGNWGTLRLDGDYRAAATSSVLGRSWSSPTGETRHHLIDPATMRASRSDVAQCTVTGMAATECEVWAKVICIVGWAEGTFRLRLAGSDCEALAFTRDGRTRLSRAAGPAREERWQEAAAAEIPLTRFEHSNIRRNSP
ncbi:FAD:protein FMN transferase [Paenibacillus methanolicus]|uniref:FAD:protein FMN transferase n=1 Tax=Paenibacillus methanolicus TaxID=582686 RepID=A0A5S5CBZ9_9BACL|nr:FAD:protein FMN transferase [Paenibacillus methanolicus]TYP75523.1 thiamine biosynthesis lipoprotein [Paenibacillus methanolicus]